MKNLLRALWRDERGQDLIEYALLAGLLTVVGGAILPNWLVSPISAIYSRVCVQMSTLGGA